MIERVLIYIKHNLKFTWRIIEWANSLLFKLICKKRFDRVIPDVFAEYSLEGLEFRVLDLEDLKQLSELINRQPKDDLEYFKPHEFDSESLLRILNNPAFLMMGAFDGEKIVGYFFLRCFWNNKCFVGRFVDRNYQGRGIGKVMNDIMYNIAWRARFRCLSTISKNNKAVMTAHAKNQTMVILKELDNDYMLVEFIDPHRAKGKK